MNRVCSIFAQVWQFIARLEFAAAVRKHEAEYHARGFRCWTQLVAMLFCQLGRAQSLREIVGGLAACEGKLQHLGLESAPKRSTLAYMPTNIGRGSCFRARLRLSTSAVRPTRCSEAAASSASSTSC